MDRAVAMIAVHLGVIDEEQINNMSYNLFNDIIEQLGIKLNYDAVINYAGNSFVEKSWDMIQDSNPMNVTDSKNGSKRSQKSLVDFFSKAKVVEKGSAEIPRAHKKGK